MTSASAESAESLPRVEQVGDSFRGGAEQLDPEELRTWTVAELVLDVEDQRVEGFECQPKPGVGDLGTPVGPPLGQADLPESQG